MDSIKVSCLLYFFVCIFMAKASFAAMESKVRFAPVCPPSGDHYYPHEDCRKYYVCTNGILYDMTCPITTYWNQPLTICDYDDSNCSAEPSTAPPSPTPTSTPPVTDVPSSTTPAPVETTTENLYPCPATGSHTFPHPSVCRLYYRCYSGELLGIYSCGDNHWYDSRSQTCVPPSDSDCPYEQRP